MVLICTVQELINNKLYVYGTINDWFCQLEIVSIGWNTSHSISQFFRVVSAKLYNCCPCFTIAQKIHICKCTILPIFNVINGSYSDIYIFSSVLVEKYKSEQLSYVFQSMSGFRESDITLFIGVLYSQADLEIIRFT